MNKLAVIFVPLLLFLLVPKVPNKPSPKSIVLAPRRIAFPSSFKAKPKPKTKTIVKREMIVTAYTKNDKSMNGKGITASGKPVQEGVTVAAPSDIPLGTKLYIPALKHTYTVTDRGGAITGNRLDLYVAVKEKALTFGVKKLEVIVERRAK